MNISINEIQHNTAVNFYTVIVTYIKSDKHYMFGQSKTKNEYFIQEILPNGTLGTMTDNGAWSYYYDFVTVLDDNGEKFLCCTSTQHNVIKLVELTYDGKVRNRFEHDYSQDDFKTFAPYMRNGKLFAYRQQNNATKDWQIIEIKYSP